MLATPPPLEVHESSNGAGRGTSPVFPCGRGAGNTYRRQSGSYGSRSTGASALIWRSRLHVVIFYYALTMRAEAEATADFAKARPSC